MVRKKTTQDLIAKKPSLEAFSQIPRIPITVVVDDVRSLDNVGLLFRIADGFRIRELILCGITGYPAQNHHASDDRPSHLIERHDRRIKRTAIQTVPLVPWTYCSDVVSAVRGRKEKGDSVVVLEQTHESVDYRNAMYDSPLTIVVGHERTGVDDAVLAIADQVVEIPMHGFGNSHNVAIATALLLARIVE